MPSSSIIYIYTKDDHFYAFAHSVFTEYKKMKVNTVRLTEPEVLVNTSFPISGECAN
jgi:hypothetical protein